MLLALSKVGQRDYASFIGFLSLLSKQYKYTAHKIFCVVGTLGLWDSVSLVRDLGLPHFYQWSHTRLRTHVTLRKVL